MISFRKALIAISNRHDVFYRAVLVVIAVLVITFILPPKVRFKYDYQAGQPWGYEDFRAPVTFPLFKSTVELDAEKSGLLSNAPLFYRKDTTIRYRVIERVSKISSPDYVERVVIQAAYDRGIVSLKDEKPPGLDQTLYIVSGEIWEPTGLSMVITSEQLPEFIAGEFFKATGRKVQDGWAERLSAYIVADLQFDKELTTQYRQELIRNISPVRGEIPEGTMIVRKGQLVGEYELLVLESLRRAFGDDQILGASRPWLYAGYLLLVLSAVTVLLVFLWLLRKDILLDSRRFSLLFLLIAGTCVVYSLVQQSEKVNMLIFPLCILPLVTRAFFDTRTALFTHVLTVLVLGTVAPGGFEFVFMQIIAGMVAIFSIFNMAKRSQLFVAVSIIFAAYLVCHTGLTLLNEGTVESLSVRQPGLLLANCLLTLLSYPLIFLIEKLFRVTSDFTLMELTDFNSFLIRELALKAPGTFQHSLQVANLAEAAIYRIGGNSLLVRAGALYHDIGKMDMPMYFIENQSTQVNPHDELSFDESAALIISHVIRGIEKARKHNVPDNVIDFIRTHHGTMMVQYFYNKYIKSFPDQLPNEDDFRYPGPRPFSRETAVLMMADSVEASARSLPLHDQDSLDQLVEKVISHQVECGQFENCDITYKDITTVKKTFKKMLTSIYHVRVAYSA